MKLPRWTRLLVAFATALCAWVVATPARAAAPLCDQRGATMFAPAPQLQLPETSIDVGPSPEDDCLARLAHATTAEDGRTPSPPAATATSDSAVPLSVNGVADPAWVPLRAARDATSDERDGVRLRVDRPPRG